MENSQSGEGSSTSNVSGEGSDSRLQLNIKTLDSRLYSFDVDKNLRVSAFKEIISSQSGVPVWQQRLIFRGKVLKDDHVLSEYNVENGDTLHLVERQAQPPPSSNPGEATSSNWNRGPEPSIGGPRNRIAHSVVLGTLNVGDSGDAITGVPDLSRVIGSVLNSIGVGNLAAGIPPGVQVPAPQGSEMEGMRVNAGNQAHSGNPSVTLQNPNPLGAVIPIPSLNTPIPDSLNTLMEFINRMEVVLQENGLQQDQSPPPAASGNQSPIQLPANSLGLPTVEALTTVMRNAQRLLTDNFVPALSRTVERLHDEGFSSDPAVRGQVHSESMRIGVAMQHLGALLLELGRTTMTLRMGQSSDDSFVTAGPAVYISPSGPNPIMVQPFPLQTSSLFSGSAGTTSNPVGMGPVGTGGIPRNVNIHIHTGASLTPVISTMGGRATNVDGTQGEAGNRADSGGNGQGRVVSGINVTTTAIPVVVPASVPMPGAAQSTAVPLRGSDFNSVSSLIAGINAQLRNLVNPQSGNGTDGSSDQGQQNRHAGTEDNSSRQTNMASSRNGESVQTVSGATIDDGTVPRETCQPSKKSHNEPSSSKQDSDDQSVAHKNAETPGSIQVAANPDSSSTVPLGLGLGGLQAKKKPKQTRTQAKNNDGANSSTQNQQARAVGQHVLQSLASLSTDRGNASPQPSNVSTQVGENTEGNEDIAEAMSQMLQNPSVDGLLAGVSQQTGIGSPDMLRNILQQFSQNPAMRNTVNQIAQQVDFHGHDSMFSGAQSGGGFDLSRMMQQMMPIVSQALGGMSSTSQRNPPPFERVEGQSNSRGESSSISLDAQNLNLRPVVQRLANQSSANDVFQSLVDSSMYLTGEDVGEDFVRELSSQGGIVQEFTEMLRRDIARRFDDGEMGS